MVKKYKIVLIAFFMLGIISGCGYEPLAGKKDKNFSIERFEISGDKRRGRILSNNINTSSGKSNQLYLNIKSKKSRKISNKSTTGKILEYTNQGKEVVVAGCIARLLASPILAT